MTRKKGGEENLQIEKDLKIHIPNKMCTLYMAHDLNKATIILKYRT